MDSSESPETTRSTRSTGSTGSTEPDRRLGRIVTLDGVRAVAVVLTSLVHVLPKQVPGGFIGVDMFFVLSGFLITSILLGEFGTTGRIRLGAFYIRRVRRLLPAVVALMVVFVLVTLVISPHPYELKVAAVVVGSVFTYTFNWTGAFGHDPPWQTDHLWSLSVEEQFYFVWPIILVFALSRMRRTTLVRLTLAAVVLASLAQGAAWLFTHDPSWAYEGSPFHAEGIILGCLIAQLYIWRMAEPALAWVTRSRVVPIVSLVVIAILVATLDLDDAPPYVGGMALASLAAGVLMVSLVGRETFGVRDWLTRVFGHPWMVVVGKRSYSIYLWQNFMAWALTSSLRGSWLWIPANIVCTGIAAEISYRFVERRFMKSGHQPSAPKTPVADPSRPAGS